MSKTCLEPNSELYRLILEFCRYIAGSSPITGLSLFDYCSGEATHSKGAMEAVVIIHDFPARIMSNVKVIAGRTIVVVAVDQWVFERDIERGFLGEASAGTLVFPYVSLAGEGYLHAEEVKLKKRLILELMENLRIGFSELSDRLQIKPEYFMYEVLLNRVRVFAPLAPCVSNFMRDTEHAEKRVPTLAGYLEALRELEKEAKVKISDGYVMIPKKLVSDGEKSRIWLKSISRNAPRTLFTPIFNVFPQLLHLFSQNTESLPKLQSYGHWRKNLDATRAFIDPENYVFVPTSKGLVSLADRVNVEAYVRDKVLHGEKGEVSTEALGGVLNDVYLVKANYGDEEKRILVKRFKDWSGFKWFPLNLWSLGTAKFAVSAKSRLERESAISEILRGEGFNVPKVLHVSHGKRLVFMEYIEGENLANQIRRIANSKTHDYVDKEFATLSQVGELIARVHSLNVTLGDTKPENVIVNSSGEIFLLDFEQASHGGGDKAWDIAEFLYYAGHYLPALQGVGKAEAIAQAFLTGYLKAGGNVNVVRKAASPKYTRVFSIFTVPSVLTAMAGVCRKAEALS